MEHFDPVEDIITFNDHRDQSSHGNTVVPIPEDRGLFSFRNISTVGIIHKSTGDIIWKLGCETLAQQHDPVCCLMETYLSLTMVPTGFTTLFRSPESLRLM